MTRVNRPSEEMRQNSMGSRGAVGSKPVETEMLCGFQTTDPQAMMEILNFAILEFAALRSISNSIAFPL
jgi:hypothetical protein